jgi:hypothetical protein
MTPEQQAILLEISGSLKAIAFFFCLHTSCFIVFAIRMIAK